MKKHHVKSTCICKDRSIFDQIELLKRESKSDIQILTNKIETALKDLRKETDVSCKKVGKTITKLGHKLEMVETAVLIGQIDKKKTSRRTKKTERESTTITEKPIMPEPVKVPEITIPVESSVAIVDFEEPF